MSHDAERTLAQWATLWNSHNIDQILILYTEDCIYEDVTFGIVNHGKSEVRAFAERFFTTFPDWHVDLKSQFVAGEWATMEWVLSGTHEGNLQGIPATHKKVSVRGVTVVELDNTKIKRSSDYWNLTTVLKQIGLMPSL